jgi:hypothetical protein
MTLEVARAPNDQLGLENYLTVLRISLREMIDSAPAAAIWCISLIETIRNRGQHEPG